MSELDLERLRIAAGLLRKEFSAGADLSGSLVGFDDDGPVYLSSPPTRAEKVFLRRQVAGGKEG